MKLPTDWQCRHIFPIPIFLGFGLMFLGLHFMDGFITWGGILLILFTSIIFNFVLPEHGDPWSQREADGTANEKPNGQADNAQGEAQPPAQNL